MDTKGIERVKELTVGRKSRVVIMPLYKSFIDLLVMHYVHFFNEVKMGFQFANFEDRSKIQLIEGFCKKLGMFFIRRHEPHNHYINYINQALI